jgi:hypothetical protein
MTETLPLSYLFKLKFPFRLYRQKYSSISKSSADACKGNIYGRKPNYCQPGLLCTSQNFAHTSKFLGKKYFLGTKVTSEAFLSIPQNLKVTRLQGGTQTKL